MGLLLCTIGISSGADHVDSRCACKCPEAAWFDIDSSWEERKIYINSSVEAADCDCEHVVVPLLKLDAEMAEKFCPRCLCKAETRSVLTIKVVVGLIIWVLALLLIYLGYLVCLEPFLTGTPRSRATGGQYRHHQDEQRSMTVWVTARAWGMARQCLSITAEGEALQGVSSTELG